ncbi:MAG: lipid biosynthesis B12-binding/radical SAM protein [Dissulfurispiraceae bacterium]
MKILIISANREREPYPVAPIGASYVAGALRKEGHETRVLDLCFEENPDTAIMNIISDFCPDIIGLSIRNIDNVTYGKSVYYMPAIKGVVETIKQTTDAPIVAGGSGFSIFPEETLRYLSLEIGILGEGEQAFVRFVDAFQNGDSLDSVPNFCRVRNGLFTINQISYSGGFSVPDRSLLDNSKYLELGGMGNIQTKRGCPFSCTYCTYPAIEGFKLRVRDAAEVADELQEARGRDGIDYIFFVDDIFNFPEEHAMAVCEEMIRRDVKMDWTCFATPFGMSREMATLMKRAGCKGVEFGTDGGSEKTLAALGKCFTPGDVVHAADCCRSVDLPHAHYIIMGGPGEDMTTIEETFSLFEHIKPTAVIALIGVRIYPNTRMRQRAVEDGIIQEKNSLFKPEFYLTRAMDAGTLVKTIAGYAADRFNWIVPALDIHCDADLLALLRKRGHRGPLWDLLP